MQNNFFNKMNRVYFIGIGGIGISAIARMLISQGKKVSGSDTAESEITSALRKLGANITIGQSIEYIKDDIDLVIYSPAIKIFDPKLIEEIKNKNILAITYPEALHEISKTKYTIAVSGTHGKTTVTAMIAKVLIDAGLDPTVVVGSLIKDKNGESTNFIAGSSDYFVVEACEYERSFLNIEPRIAVINNIDADHLDYYGDLNGVIVGFNEFAKKVSAHGFIVCDSHDEKVAKALVGVEGKIIDRKESYPKSIKLMVPGEHNRLNAATAIAVAKVLGVENNQALKSLESFSGAWRRFEYKGKTKDGTLIYDDYAHNPQKVAAALQGAREMFPDKRIVAVFQPHLFSRTKLLLNEFACAFFDADEIVLAPIFPAREVFDPTISSVILAAKIKENNKEAKAFVSFEDVENYLKSSLKSTDLLITMGAGEQYKIGENLL